MIAVFNRHNGKYGVINARGVQVISCQYDSLRMGYNFISARKDQQWRVFDNQGHVVWCKPYDVLEAFDNHGIAVFGRGKGFGLVGICGNVIVEPIYQRLSDGINGIYVGYDSEGVCIFDLNRFVNERLKYSWILYNGDLERIGYYDKRRQKYGYLSLNGGKGVSAKFDEIDSFSSGFAPVLSGKECFFIDRNGSRCDTIDCQSLRGFRQGRAAFQVGGQWGFLASPHEIAIEPRFKEVNSFSCGYCFVEDYEGYFINKFGHRVFDRAFEAAGEFNLFGLASVITKGKNTVINTNGSLVWNDDSSLEINSQINHSGKRES